MQNNMNVSKALMFEVNPQTVFKIKVFIYELFTPETNTDVLQQFVCIPYTETIISSRSMPIGGGIVVLL